MNMDKMAEKKLRVRIDEIINNKSNWENHLIDDKKIINEIVEYLKSVMKFDI